MSRSRTRPPRTSCSWRCTRRSSGRGWRRCGRACRPQAIVVSLAPKVPLSAMATALGTTRVARMIPNAPSLIGRGYNPVTFGTGVDSDARAALAPLFTPWGEWPEVEERTLEAYAILTGMGPTYFWYQWQALRELAGQFGLSPPEDRRSPAAHDRRGGGNAARERVVAGGRDGPDSGPSARDHPADCRRGLPDRVVGALREDTPGVVALSSAPCRRYPPSPVLPGPPFSRCPSPSWPPAAAAAAYDDRASLLATLLALVGLVSLHAAVNAFNEASDMKTGIDLQHAAHAVQRRERDVAGRRDVGPRRELVGAVGSAIGLGIGLYFGWTIGWWPLSAFMVLGAVSVLIYTQVFARSGVGEVFAGLGLGLLPVVGTALVQYGVIGPAAWAAGVPAFFMTFNLLLLNEFPDEAADRAGGRKNLVLLLGRKRRRWSLPWPPSRRRCRFSPRSCRRPAGLGSGRGARRRVVRSARGAVGDHAPRGTRADSRHGRQRHLEPRDEHAHRGGAGLAAWMR